MVVEKSPAGTLVYKYNEYSSTATDSVATSQISSGHNMLYIKAPTYGRTAIASMTNPKYVTVTTERGVIRAHFLNEGKQEVGEMHINIDEGAIASQLTINAWVAQLTGSYDKQSISGFKINNDSIVVTGDGTTYSAYFGSDWNTYVSTTGLVGDNPFTQSSVSQAQIDELNTRVDQCVEDIDALKPLASEMKAYYVSR